MPPTISPDLTSASACCSKPRISRIRAYRSAGLFSGGAMAFPPARPRLGRPQHRAIVGVAVVGGARAGLADDHVVVVDDQAAVGLVALSPSVPARLLSADGS